MSSVSGVKKYRLVAAARPPVKVVTGDLSSAVTRGPLRDQSPCSPKSFSSWSFLPVQTPSAYRPLDEGKAEESKSLPFKSVECWCAPGTLDWDGTWSPGVLPANLAFRAPFRCKKWWSRSAGR